MVFVIGSVLSVILVCLGCGRMCFVAHRAGLRAAASGVSWRSRRFAQDLHRVSSLPQDDSEAKPVTAERRRVVRNLVDGLPHVRLFTTPKPHSKEYSKAADDGVSKLDAVEL